MIVVIVLYVYVERIIYIDEFCHDQDVIFSKKCFVMYMYIFDKERHGNKVIHIWYERFWFLYLNWRNSIF